MIHTLWDWLTFVTPHDQEPHSLAAFYWSVGLLVFGACLLSCLVYLIVAPRPEGEHVGMFLVGGALGIIVWPAALLGGVLYLFVTRMRKLIHGRPTPPPDYAKINRLQREMLPPEEES